ncbi:glycosyltransferase family 8 protein, partial [Erysipelotrichaceae bacterium OttesenSCG-928-M19]|nr:glycosyltransferase family 8 protein [Erysipelotrichaceae bacterium OttesenSCG-928-M19]
HLYGRYILQIDDALYNYDARNYSNYLIRSAGIQNIDWVLKNTAVLHFCGKSKPWNSSYVYRFGILYKHYLNLASKQ